MNFYEGDLNCLGLSNHVGKTFNSLFVLGRIKGTTCHVVKCEICQEDGELFKDAIFKIETSHLLRDCKPCGCSTQPKWELWQKRIRIERKLNNLNFKLLSLNESECIIMCPFHGELKAKSIDSVLRGKFCKFCGHKIIGKAQEKSDSTHIDDFLSAGTFPIGTKFLKISAKRWQVSCGDCGETYSGLLSNLKNGAKGCSCSKFSPVYGYIHLISDNGLPLCLKFGITNNPRRREINQSSRTVYDLESIGLWKFDNTAACKNAEKEIKSSVKCGLLDKREMEDGFTETTSLLELDKIMKIYENNGGVKW